MNQNVTNLSYSQRQNRLQCIKILRKYWEDEQFPINTTHRKKIPQIRDQKGTLCALAYILHNSGECSLVEDLAQNNNFVLVNDVPDDHYLIDVITNNGISKNEAAKIQPSYSCHAVVGPTQTGEPVVELVGIVLSIVGLITALSFYWGLNHVLFNIDKRTIMIVIFLGIAATGGGISMIYQNTMAEPFDDADFPGDYNSINIIDNISIHYWIDEGKIENSYNGNYFEITPTGDGQIIIAYPPIITKGYRTYYSDNYYEHVIVLVNGEEIEHTQYELNGYSILKVPFSEDDRSVEIINGVGMCNGFIFDDSNIIPAIVIAAVIGGAVFVIWKKRKRKLRF
jgi:hypothetical protein